jgi:hypothetical protein
MPTEPSSIPSRTPIVFDDFNGEGNLTDNWILSSPEGADLQAHRQIYAKSGKLNLVVSPTNSINGADATLTPILPDQTIQKVSMEMALVSQKGLFADGAAYLILSDAKGNEGRLWMGPGATGRPGHGYSICVRGLCEASDMFHAYPVSLGSEYMAEASVDEVGELYIHLGNLAASAEGFGPITNFKFYLSSDPKRNFHVTVDDIRITYN